jgi:cell division protein FtsL
MEPHQLGNSHFTAEQRLHELERKLAQNPELKIQYHNFMKEYEELGHMKQVTSQDRDELRYFLPHHAVFKDTSTTTKTRVFSMAEQRLQMDYL